MEFKWGRKPETKSGTVNGRGMLLVRIRVEAGEGKVGKKRNEVAVQVILKKMFGFSIGKSAGMGRRNGYKRRGVCSKLGTRGNMARTRGTCR
jgi:hypothetical protein